MSNAFVSFYAWTACLGARLRSDRKALESLEWAVIAAVIVVVAIAAYNSVLGGVTTFFGNVSSSLGGVQPTFS